MAEPQAPETWRETVLDEWTDYNGHMNLAYYVLVFDHATDAFYPHVGLGVDRDRPAIQRERMGRHGGIPI